MSKERTPAPSTERQTRAPNGSALTYGLVGFSLAVVVLLAVAGFYDINLLRHGLLIVGVTALAAVAGIVVHFKRTARYRAALESCVASCLHLKGASMTMSTKIIPFHRRAHSVITRAAPDAGDPRFARELARAGLPLRRAPELKGKNDEHPVH